MDMKTIQPAYYEKFICIADKCPYTCCQQWDISVDDKTVSDWQKRPLPDKTGFLSSCLRSTKEGTVLKFASNKKCHLLNEQGLCSVVLTYGEEKIPCTCHVFPREEMTYADHTEKALSPACPYVLDLLWEHDTFELTGDLKEPKEMTFALRDWFLEIFKERRESTEEILKVLFLILNDLQGKTMDAQAFEAYKKETDLDAVFKWVFDYEDGTSSADRFREQNELFLDLVDPYVKQKKYEDFLNKVISLKTLRKEFYERYLKLYIWEEIGSSLIGDAKLSTMLVKLEWIILEYVAIRHALHLQSAEQTLSYEEIRETFTIMSRIMGYTDQEILQFMKEEFESEIWPLSYLFYLI